MNDKIDKIESLLKEMEDINKKYKKEIIKTTWLAAILILFNFLILAINYFHN